MLVTGTQTTQTRVQVDVNEFNLIDQICDTAVGRIVDNSYAFVNADNKVAVEDNNDRHPRDIILPASDEQRDQIKLIREAQHLMKRLSWK